MNKKVSAKKYIDWMLPSIKQEVFQANSKIGIIISINAALMASLLIIISLVNLFPVRSITKIILYSSLGFIVFCQFASVFTLLISLISVFELKQRISDDSKFDYSLFYTFSNISIDNYLKIFQIEDDLEEKMIRQIYINSNIAVKRYKAIKVAIIFTFL